jgi:D-alanyl-lipoteichoic acid acyltransferase DltB (MBOAT superfamily)
MIFTSLNFLIFFPIVTILYWILPAKHRWLLLLITSYFFYLNIKPVFALLLIFVSVSTWIFTLQIDKTEVESRKKKLMITNIALLLLPLFFFKYFGEINNGILAILESYHIRWALPEIKLILPVGISFYTFMAIGYTIDVYNEEVKAEKNLGIVALFTSFFPLILSGPIERAKNMLPQFKTSKVLDYDMVVAGMKMMLWGYFMKLVVADRLGIYIDAIDSNIVMHNGTTLLFTSLLYPFQLYADLGGYSLIAIGTAKIMGINVMQNFKRPFMASSMSELWRRWHISLISWLTDYVYTPLSFSLRKFKVWGIVIALITTFIISGIWHGAAITFVVWGLVQGIFLSIEALTNKKKAVFEEKYKLSKKKWYIFFGIIVTFVLFAASQIFGRAKDLGEAFVVFKKIITNPGAVFIGTPSTFLFFTLGVLMILFKDITEEFMPTKFRLFDSKNKFIRKMAYSLIVILILLIGVFDGGQFIYFQF